MGAWTAQRGGWVSCCIEVKVRMLLSRHMSVPVATSAAYAQKCLLRHTAMSKVTDDEPVLHPREFIKPRRRARAGLVFFNLSEGPESTEKRLALLFFVLLLFELLPFCYMSFYVADRRFFAADVSNDLYHPSAYYLAAVVAGAAAGPHLGGPSDAAERCQRRGILYSGAARRGRGGPEQRLCEKEAACLRQSRDGDARPA